MRTNVNNFLIRSFIFLTIVDDFSRFTWIFLMTNKSEARPLIINYFLTQKLNSRPKPNAFEVIKVKNTKCLKFMLIQESFIAFSIPQQNSVVERKHQSILHVARAFDFKLNYKKDLYMTSQLIFQPNCGHLHQSCIPIQVSTFSI